MAQQKAKNVESVCGMKNKQAFSLIEIMVVIGIIMLVTTISIPAYRTLFPKKNRQAFISQLNALTNMAWRKAVATNSTSIVFFDLKNRRITAGTLTGKKGEKGPHDEPQWKPLQGAFVASSMPIPAEYRFTSFSIESVNELESVRRDFIWFFITPNGISQRVELTFVDTSKKQQTKKERVAQLRMNPFNGQFVEVA